MKKTLLAALMAAARPGACGGGGGDAAPPPATSQVPASASQSVDGFISYLRSWSPRRPTCSSRSTRRTSSLPPTTPSEPQAVD